MAILISSYILGSDGVESFGINSAENKNVGRYKGFLTGEISTCIVRRLFFFSGDLVDLQILTNVGKTKGLKELRSVR